MRKKKNRRSLIWKIFHTPFFIIFLFILLPIFLWAVQQSQQYFSRAQSSNCPTTSTQTYNSISPSTPRPRKIQSPQSNPEVNIDLRGWTLINEGKGLVHYGGDTDPNAPPSIGSIFAGHEAKIINTYVVNAWDYQNHKNIPGENATPAWPVTMIGLATSPGEPLLGLAAGRNIQADFTLMVLYASPTSITFTHSDGDLAPPDDDGYPYYFADICVDPNLLALYQKDNAEDRNVLPAIRAGQIFGYASNAEVKVAVRDTNSFMDPRSQKDWWQLGPATGTAYTPPSQPTNISQPTAPPAVNPSPVIPILTSPPVAVPTGNSIVIATTVPVQPTTQPKNPVIIYISATPIPVMPTSIPPTATPTPAPLIDIGKTVNNAKSAWSNFITSILQFTKAILP